MLRATEHAEQQEETTSVGGQQEKQEEQACDHSNLKPYGQLKAFLDPSRAWAQLGFPPKSGTPAKPEHCWKGHMLWLLQEDLLANLSSVRSSTVLLLS